MSWWKTVDGFRFDTNMILKALLWGFGSELIKVINEKVKNKVTKLFVRISEGGIQVTVKKLKWGGTEQDTNRKLTHDLLYKRTTKN